MKKVFIALLLLFVSQGIFAQHDWTKLNSDYLEVFRLAEIISEQTNRVTVSDDTNHIGILRSGDVSVNFDRKLDSRESVHGKFYKYYLGSSNSETRAQLDKIATEKVVTKYRELLTKLKVSLDEERDDKVDDLLNSLFN